MVSISCVLLWSFSYSFRVGFSANASATCYEGYSCANAGDPDEIQQLSEYTDLRCYGYHSCYNRNPVMTTDSSINCYGSYSCYSAQSLLADDGNVDCNGLSSCERVELTESDYSHNCDAERSCYNSTMTKYNSINCDGDRSCANSYFDEVSYLSVYGYLGISNSTFVVEPAEELDLYLYGTSSSKNIQIILNTDSSVDLRCYGPDSCSGIDISCKDSSCNINFRCSERYQANEYCDTGYDILDYNIVAPEISITSNYENAAGICQNSGAVCDDYSSSNGICDDNTISSSNTICCSAYEACYYADIIEYTGTNAVAIRCDGYQSCASSGIIIRSLYSGNIYLTGENAAYSSDTIIETPDDILCSGYRSCRRATFRNAKNVYCTGQGSCDDANYYNITNIYVYSYNGYVCCDDDTGSEVENIKGNMYIHSASSSTLQNSKINNVEGIIYISGSYAVRTATISNVDGIVVQGYVVLAWSTVRGFNFINATGRGQEILQNTKLISESPSGTTTLDLNISETENIDFYCNQTDTCNINCHSSVSCLYLTVYCYGDCYVSCDPSSDISCPTLGAGEYNLELSEGMYELVSSGVNTQCHDAFGCKGINGYLASSLECYGYSSCMNGKEVVFIALDNSIQCYGSYSCFNTSISTYGGGVISCSGLRSCSTIKSAIGERIECYGELSCADSSIEATSLVSCYGDRSCENSQITVPCCEGYRGWQQVYIFGSYGAANSIFEVGSVSYGDNNFFVSSITTTNGPTTTRAPDDTDIYRVTDIYIYLYGNGAAYNSVFYCGFGKRCIFMCAGANACAQLTWYCGSQNDYSSDNTGCTVFMLCDDVEIDDFVLSDAYTPTTQQSGDFCVVNNDLLLATSSQITTNALETCDTSKDDSNTEICDDYQECSDNTISISDSGGDAHICCTGTSSCETVNNINVIDNSDSSTNLIRCDGSNSCNQVSGFTATGGGNFYFSSSNAMDGATVTSDTSGSNAYCTAASSCQDGIFSELSTVICSGYDSCANAMISNVDNVYQLGSYSSEDVAPRIDQVSNNVYCGARSACEGSTISNVNNKLYGLGDSALRSATITNVNELIIDGYRAFYASSITGVSTVSVSGDESLDWSEIISDLNGGEMILSVDVDYTENAAFVTCSSGDTCDIYCLSSVACQYIVLYCYGTCTAYCDDSNGVSCPNGADGTSYTRVGNFTLPPTEEPSVPPGTPTSMPTESSEGGSKNGGNNNDDDNEIDLTLIIIIGATCLTLIVLAVIIVTYLKSKHKFEYDRDNQVQLVDQTSAGVSPRGPAVGATLTPGGITNVSQPGLVGIANNSIPVNPLDRHSAGENAMQYAVPGTN